MSCDPESDERCECSCEQCVSACSFKPGWMLPGDAERMAEHLGVTLDALFTERLGVDWWEDTSWKREGGLPYTEVLAPATTTMVPGNLYTQDPHGVCTFLKEGKCEVHPAKPFECRQMLHSDSRDDTQARKRLVVKAWGEEPERLEKLRYG